MSRIIWGNNPTKWQVGNNNYGKDGERIYEDDKPWFVAFPSRLRGREKFFHTHAEAIAYAQEQAEAEAHKVPTC